MIRRVLYVLFLVTIFILGYRYIPVDSARLLLQPIITISTVFVAAILVRLSRGVPSLEWKATDLLERNLLLDAIKNLAKEYIFAIIVCAVLILLSLFAIVYIPAQIENADNIQLLFIKVDKNSTLIGILGSIFFLLLLQISKVIWRDYDIITLQSQLIGRIGEEEAHAFETKSAKSKIDQMKSARIQK